MIPKALCDQVGLRAGEVDISADGSGLPVEPFAGDPLEERGGRLVVAPAGQAVDDDMVRILRDAAQR